MASSLTPERKYHVFLSFRGEDVRNNFLGHLYRALDQKGIYTYVDSEELRKGEQIAPALMKAIEESHIAIIIFSKDYASSRWCLEELVKIIDCKKERDLIVFPLFYKVEPRELRTPRGSYRDAMVDHESKYGKDSKEVKRWEEALSHAGNLSGWHLKDGDESELIQRIVKEISTNLDQTPLDVAEPLVGIDSRLAKLKSMLNLESNDGVLMVGLWGQGGIGKTTIAKVLYNAIYGLFEGSCFLANVREASKDDKGLVSLQERLLSEILSLQKTLVVSNVHRGAYLIPDRLRCRKVLLILDDVDHLRQLKYLAREGKWFGNGSRIIITTRDKHLLTYSKIEQVHVYEVETMGYSEARELLSKHAFPTQQKLKIKTNLVDGVLHYANGLPLAIEVLGSFLRGRREDEWESTLDKISAAPNKDINDVLKISYEGLEANEKEIFLHIACFFKWWKIDYIKKVLDSCDYKATIGLQILMEKSLIRTKSGSLEMHDLIQLMGMDIVNQEYADPRRRSRLWLCDDVLNVLTRDVGECDVKAIVLKPTKPTEIYIDYDAFTKMRSLRLLILHNVHNSFQGPIVLSNELRWFEWTGHTSQILEFSSGEKKLVGLNISNCSITEVPNQLKGFQHLKYMNLSDCNSLVCTPDLSCAPNLEEFCVFGCKNLVKIHESVAYHDKLRMLCLSRCDEFSVFPNVLQSKNLQHLLINDCNKLERFPDIPHKLERLKELCITRSAIKEIPASIENLCSLKSMELTSCKNLASLPSNIYNLQNIRRLKIWSCSNFIEFPKYEESTSQHMKIKFPKLRFLELWKCNLSQVDFLEDLSSFPNLYSLDLRENNIIGLPTSISKRNRLSWLSVDGCHQLQEIPELPPYLHHLEAKDCSSLQTDGHLTSIDRWAARALTRVHAALFAQDDFSCTLHLHGKKMPGWFQPIKGNSISFMTSKDLYDKFLGLVFYFAGFNDQFGYATVYIKAYFNGERRGSPYQEDMPSKESQMLCYCHPSQLWGVADFGQIDGSYAQCKLTLPYHHMWKQLGFRIICKQLEEDLKVKIQDHQLIDPAFLYEVDHDSIGPEVKTSQTFNVDLLKNLQESLRMKKDNPIDIDLLKNLQESLRMKEDNPIDIDLLKNLQESLRLKEDNPIDIDLLKISQESLGMKEDNPINIDLLKNLQESLHMKEDNPIEIDIMKNFLASMNKGRERGQSDRNKSTKKPATLSKEAIGSKRKHEFTLPQGKRIKTMPTSNSTDGDENEMGLTDLLKNLHL